MTEDKKLRAAATAKWLAWAKSKNCDFDGKLPFSGLQKLVMTTVVESGEALVLRSAASTADGLAIPLRIRVLEPDYLDATQGNVTLKGGGSISYGIEFDASGRRVAYHIYEAHPGSSGIHNTISRRWDAADVLHIYDVERAGQNRGVPWFAPVIAGLNDLDDYEDAALLQKRIAACFGAFVQDLDGESGSLGKQDEDKPLLETLEPGHIQYLGSGKTITFAQPPQSPDQSFTTGTLRKIAAGIGVTYEDLTGDYSKVNFSSARMGRISHWANVDGWRGDMLIPQFCDGVWEWAMELAQGMNNWPEAPTAKWTPSPMPMLDPGKEGQAYERLARNGVMSLPDIIRERGNDPDEQVEEIAEFNERLDTLGLVFDSDPRKTSKSGGAQPNAGDSEDPEGEASTDDDPVDDDADE